MSTGLSKSKIIAGKQCLKRAYLEVHHRELMDDSGSAIAFAIGNELGDLARTLYPGGILIGHDDNLKAAIAETKEYLEREGDCTLFEATLAYDGVLIRADILHKKEGKVTIVEVKASTEVKKYYIEDSAIQTWVVKNSGYIVERVYLAHVDSSFVYQGGGDYDGILHYEDITEKVMALTTEVDGWVNDVRSAIEGDEPDISVGSHCTTPFNCSFMGYCYPEPAKYPVSCLPGKGKIIDELLQEGIEDIRDIPDGRLGKELQERVRKITVEGSAELDPKAIEIINNLPYPRYYLDFETVAMVVPIWIGTRPYQALPFQWSCHIEHEDGNIQHEEFLGDSGEAPMRRLAEKLIEKLGEGGPILMYTSFERTVIANLVKMFPDLEEGLHALSDRLFDLKPVVKDHYYHPDMLGSWSIKAVLPVIVPELSYKDVGEVQDGMAAGRALIEILSSYTSPERKNELEESLLAYCKLDTWAMVKVAQRLAKG